ncbi:MAG: ABC transporter ATP-binding protein [Planctomycetota bacterium]
MSSPSSPIQFHEVYRSFGNQDVLRGLSLAVRPGEIYAFLGRNGSGKTTALRVLLGFLKPMSGRSQILGVNSQELTPADRGRIGYVSEGHRLYGSFRVRDAIQFEAGTRQNFRKDYATEAAKRCGLPPKQMVMQLSRGQRAQLALIFAVAGQPEVMIFDDPAMGLDVVMRREFLDVMIDLLSDQGIGVLFSSHILTDVERIADRVGILHDGRLMVNATMAELKQRVQKRFWCGPNGVASTPPPIDGMLRSQPRRDGWELTLLDLDEHREQQLAAGSSRLSEPTVPSLEDLFLDLTAGTTPRSILPQPEGFES